MGCSYDRFNAMLPSETHAEAFAELFNQMLKEELYWGEDSFITPNNFSCGLCEEYYIDVDDEPLFNMMDNGSQLVNVILEYIKCFPDDEFSANYYCTFNNCGAVFMTDYKYNGNRRLRLEHRWSENESLSYCNECDTAFWENPICTIEDYEEGEVYHCSNCGAELEWDANIEEVFFELNGDSWERI